MNKIISLLFVIVTLFVSSSVQALKVTVKNYFFTSTDPGHGEVYKINIYNQDTKTIKTFLIDSFDPANNQVESGNLTISLNGAPNLGLFMDFYGKQCQELATCTDPKDLEKIYAASYEEMPYTYLTLVDLANQKAVRFSDLVRDSSGNVRVKTGK